MYTPTTINAQGKILGRLAGRIAYLLQGKTLASYCPEKRESGLITVYNVDAVRLSGKKAMHGVRIHHTGYPGGLKRVSVSSILEKDPRILLRRAVNGMLAHNRLRAPLMRRLTLLRGPLER